MVNESPVAMRSLSEIRKQGLTESELREGLRAYLRSSGHVSSLTAQLRHRVLTEFGAVHTVRDSREEAPGCALRIRMRWSLIAEAMRCCGLQHSVSVFVAECGLRRLEGALSREEAASLLGLENEARATVNCLLDLMLESQTRETASKATQTQGEMDSSSRSPTPLGEQLRRIREEYDAKRAKRAARPTSMEDWARECESRYASRLEAEVRRIQETEVRVAKRELESKHRKQLEAVSAAARAEAAERERTLREREAWVESKAAAEVRIAEEAAANERRELVRRLNDVAERETAQKQVIDHERRALEMYEARLEQQEAAIVWRLAAARADETKRSRLEAELANAVATVASLRAAATGFATPDEESPLGNHELLTERGILPSANFAFESSSDYEEFGLPFPAKHRRARSTPRKRRSDVPDDKAHTQPLQRQLEAMRAEYTALREESAGLRGLVAQSRAALEAVASLPASAFSRPDIASSDPNGVLRAALDALGIREDLTSTRRPRSPPAVRDDDLPVRQAHREAWGDENIERRRWELLDRLDRDKRDIEDRWRKEGERRAATQETLLLRAAHQRRHDVRQAEFRQQQGDPFPPADVESDAALHASLTQPYPKPLQHIDDTNDSSVPQKRAYDEKVNEKRSALLAESCDAIASQFQKGTLSGPTHGLQPMHAEPHHEIPSGSPPTPAAIEEQAPMSLEVHAAPDEPALHFQAQKGISRRPPHAQLPHAKLQIAPQQAPRAPPEAPAPESTTEVASIAPVEHAALADLALQLRAEEKILQEEIFPRSHAVSLRAPSVEAPKPVKSAPDMKLVRAVSLEPALTAVAEPAALAAPNPAPPAPSVTLVGAASLEPAPSALAQLARPAGHAPQVQAPGYGLQQRDEEPAEEALKEDIQVDDFCVDARIRTEEDTSAMEEVKGIIHIVELQVEAEEITNKANEVIAGGTFDECESEELDRESKQINRDEATGPEFSRQHQNQISINRAKFDDSQLCRFKEVFETFSTQDEHVNIMSLCGALDKLSGTRPRRAEIEKLLDSFCQEIGNVERNSNQIKGFDEFVAFLSGVDDKLYRPPPEVDAVALFEQKLEETRLRRARDAARRAMLQPSMDATPLSDRKREFDGDNIEDSASSTSVGASRMLLQQIAYCLRRRCLNYRSRYPSLHHADIPAKRRPGGRKSRRRKRRIRPECLEFWLIPVPEIDCQHQRLRFVDCAS